MPSLVAGTLGITPYSRGVDESPQGFKRQRRRMGDRLPHLHQDRPDTKSSALRSTAICAAAAWLAIINGALLWTWPVNRLLATVEAFVTA